jgi:hypothetical protein
MDETFNNRIHTTQIGFQPDQHKLAVVADAAADGFETIIDQERAVFIGPLAPRGLDADSGEVVAQGDGRIAVVRLPLQPGLFPR